MMKTNKRSNNIQKKTVLIYDIQNGIFEFEKKKNLNSNY